MENRTYTIRRAPHPVRLACDNHGWEHAECLRIDQFPWYKAGQKQGTQTALLYDDQALHVLFVCEDRHIWSVETRPNGNVYKDSCVEFFAIPDPQANRGYFNFEANCCSCVHLGWGPERAGRTLAGPEIHKQITVATSIPTPTKDEWPQDDSWWLAARLPFAAIGQFGGLQVAPKSGDSWRANFYRCGGKTDDQFACWNPIDWPKPDFHRPEFFGELRFE